MMLLVDGERDISRNARHSPGRDLFALFSVQDAELAGTGKRHIDLCIRFVELDAARTGIRFDVPNMCTGPRVDNREGSGFRIADANIKVFRFWVVPYVVGIRSNR